MFGLIPWRKDRDSERALTPAQDNPFELVRREFDSLFDRFFGSWPSALSPTWGGGWGLDVEDTGKEVVVRAEAPGFEAQDFDVQVSGDVLTIRAEHKEEGEGKESRRAWARLHRTVTLPAGTDVDRVEARYRNGVLELHLPKSPDALPRRIEVKS